MLVVELRRPNDAQWYTTYTYKLFILDPETGYWKGLPFENQGEVDAVTLGAQVAAQLFGKTLDWYTINDN